MLQTDKCRNKEQGWPHRKGEGIDRQIRLCSNLLGLFKRTLDSYRNLETEI